MRNLVNTIYWFGCVVAATVLGIGVVDYWLNDHRLTAFLSWAVLAAIPWLVGRPSLYVLLVARGDIDTTYHAAGRNEARRATTRQIAANIAKLPGLLKLKRD
jgi:hypothetical protein